MVSQPEIVIRRLIREQGRLSFADFMRIALYHADGGYYSRPSAFGASGDYYTSATAHPAFGALIASQLCGMWKLLGRPAPFYVIEPGAGTCQLATDILESSTTLGGDFHNSIVYLALDRYATPNTPQVRFSSVITDAIPVKDAVGCIISNELVDSFPFHRFRMDGGKVREIFVSLDEDDQFVEVLDEPSTPEISKRLACLDLSLPEGYCGEINLNVKPWTNEISSALGRGFAITIDYGYDAEEMYSIDRPQGTFDTFYRHTRGGSPYQRIGRQDITAHVDFSMLVAEGEKAGLETVGLLTQADYLDRLGFSQMLHQLRARNISQSERQSNMIGMLELVKPEGFGRFKVLIQEKGAGLLDMDEITSVEAPQNVPLMKPDNTPLLEGRYPHLTLELESLWPFAEEKPEVT